MEKLHRADASSLRGIWPLLFATILTGLVFIYYYFRDGDASGSVSGIVYGILGFVTIVFLALYKVRKIYFGFIMGSLHGWLQAHIYISVITIILVYMHTGFRFNGAFTTILLLLFFVVFASGIVGSLMHTIIPLSLAKYGKEILSTNEILDAYKKCLDDSERLVETTSEEFRETYKKSIRPLIADFSTKWQYLFTEENRVIKAAEKKFEMLKEGIPSNENYNLQILGSMYQDRERFAFKLAKLRILNGWLTFHVPVTTAMLTMLGLHLLSIFYF